MNWSGEIQVAEPLGGFRIRVGAAVLALTLLLAGCEESGDEKPNTRATGDEQSRGADVNNQGRRSNNPEEWPDVKLYRPRQLPNIAYDLNQRTVTDLDTGDKLLLRSGHAGGAGQFTMYNEKTGPIAAGAYRDWSGRDPEYLLIRVVYKIINGKNKYFARDQYDLTRIAEMMRAYSEGAYKKVQPNSKIGWDINLVVVDDRPATNEDMNPMNGLRKVER